MTSGLTDFCNSHIGLVHGNKVHGNNYLIFWHNINTKPVDNRSCNCIWRLCKSTLGGRLLYYSTLYEGLGMRLLQHNKFYELLYYQATSVLVHASALQTSYYPIRHNSQILVLPDRVARSIWKLWKLKFSYQ